MLRAILFASVAVGAAAAVEGSIRHGDDVTWPTAAADADESRREGNEGLGPSAGVRVRRTFSVFHELHESWTGVTATTTTTTTRADRVKRLEEIHRSGRNELGNLFQPERISDNSSSVVTRPGSPALQITTSRQRGEAHATDSKDSDGASMKNGPRNSAFARDMMEPRIVGGTPTNRGRYPYMASLTEQGVHFCGGTLIAPDCILSAAHCFSDAIGEIQLGRYNITNVTEQYESYIMQTLEIHPDFYLQDGDVISYDFMIVKLFGSSSDIQPVKINRDGNNPSGPGEVLTAIGWGVRSQGDLATVGGVMDEVSLQYISNRVCDQSAGFVNGIFETYTGHIDDSMLCATNDGKDSCQGDSGGPLLNTDRNGNPDNDVQIGVVSWGYGCADSDFPGVYARVSHVQDWIDSVVCRLSDNPPADFGCESVPPPSPPGPTPAPSTSPAQIAIVVEIRLDRYPRETGYIITSQMDNGKKKTDVFRPIFSYSGTTPFSLVQEVILLDMDTVYTFTMLDKYGDGICCAGGNGYFKVYEQNSGVVLVAEQGSFGYSKSVAFAVGNATLSSPPTPSPTPAGSRTYLGGPLLIVVIQLDDHPEDVAWLLEYRIQGGWPEDDWKPMELFYFDSYAGLPGKLITYQIELFGPDAGTFIYRFTIFDYASDGICCSFGQGYYKLFLENTDSENLIFEGGSFSGYDDVLFSIVFEESTSPSSSTSTTILPTQTPSGIPLAPSSSNSPSMVPSASQTGSSVPTSPTPQTDAMSSSPTDESFSAVEPSLSPSASPTGPTVSPILSPSVILSSKATTYGAKSSHPWIATILTGTLTIYWFVVTLLCC